MIEARKGAFLVAESFFPCLRGRFRREGRRVVSNRKVKKSDHHPAEPLSNQLHFYIELYG